MKISVFSTIGTEVGCFLVFLLIQSHRNNYLKPEKYKYTAQWSYEPPHDKTNKMACAPSKDSDQPRHLPNLIQVFAVRMKKTWVLSYPLSTQQRLWSDWADAMADPSLRWVQSFCWFCHEMAHNPTLWECEKAGKNMFLLLCDRTPHKNK